jgi:SAM-dependent methyltransferase
VFRTDLLKSIPIRSDRFGFEPEITMKVSKRKLRVYEVPTSYHGRTYEEGKKIGWKDGLKAFGVVLYFWIIDDLYSETYGRGLLNSLAGTPQYLSWITRVLRPYLGDTVLEIGAGLGNLTGRLMGKKLMYVAAEKDPLYLHALRNRFLRTPSVNVCELDPEQPSAYAPWAGQFESALCANVLETADDPQAVIQSIAGCMKPHGKLIVLAPQGPALFGSLDRAMGHKRRFSAAELSKMLETAGLKVEQEHQLNKFGALNWWIFGHLLGRSKMSRVALKLWDKTVWFWRRVDVLLPWRGSVAGDGGAEVLSGDALPWVRLCTRHNRRRIKYLRLELGGPRGGLHRSRAGGFGGCGERMFGDKFSSSTSSSNWPPELAASNRLFRSMCIAS